MSRLSPIALLLATGAALAAGPPAVPPGADPGANAALRYWRAFAAARFAGVGGDRPLPEDARAAPLDARTRELVAAGADALGELRGGAAVPVCAWGVRFEEGPDTPMDHRKAMRELVTLACLRARLHFKDGRPGEAVDDLLAAMTLTRHLSTDGSIASIFIGHTAERVPVGILARHLPGLDAAAFAGLARRLEALPPGGDLGSAYVNEEKSGIDWLARGVRAAKGREDLLRRLAALPALKDKAPEFLEACGGTAEGVVRRIDETRPYRRSWARKLSLPADRFESEVAPEAAELARTNPVYRMLTPPPGTLRQAEAVRQTERALLRAAVAVQGEGAGALERFPDPSDGKPFGHEPLAGGFRLTSRLKHRDSPLTLTVGAEPKE
jgi:hypothetical protein